MASSAIETHDALVAATVAQRGRLGQAPEEDRWTGALAQRFRSDPRREPEGLLQAFLERVRPEDTVLDVGGGGGRFSLALALKCRQVINVDPSAGMHEVFDAVASESGIKNARYVQQDWLDSEGFAADVTIVSHVTYFVSDIAKFVAKLEAATRRLVIIDVTATPNPNRSSDLFKVVWGEEQALVPGYRDLLPALWEMGILPDVSLLPEGSFRAGGSVQTTFASRAEAIASTVDGNLSSRPEAYARTIETQFDELFRPAGSGFERIYRADQRQVVISWSPSKNG